MLELIFITSNSAKLAHARHLCREYAVRISKQKNYGVGYIEPRVEDRNELIKMSVEDAIIRFRKSVSNSESKFFFIEDTSVVINNLSHEKEYPGVDIKYWMRENTFDDIDKELKKNGNDRSAIVRSDLILVLTEELARQEGSPYKIFTSKVTGRITEKEYHVNTQPLYPWLSEKTFNKWFIPDGCIEPMSLLNIVDADKFDFRAGAFNQMLDFLHRNQIIYTNEEYQKSRSQQLSLFVPVNFIICGPTCAGKTTLATYLIENYSYYHLEASDFMYLSYYERHGIGSEVPIGDFAEQALKDNPSIVTDQIIQNIKKIKSVPVVITGFRNPKEVESFKSQYKGNFAVTLIYVDADQNIRFERSRSRNRYQEKDTTYDDFKKRDEQQRGMGLPLIEDDSQSKKITNNGTYQEFYEAFESLYNKQLLSTKTLNELTSYFPKNKLQNVIISALAKELNSEQYFTTTEIAHLINSNTNLERPKNKNNVSRYFNQNFHPYFEIKVNEDGHACYKLSQTGIAYSKFIE